MTNFYTWLLDNQCLFKHERFQEFIDNCIEDLNLFEINTEKDLFIYLSVNGYDEELIISALRVWYCYQYLQENEGVIIDEETMVK